MPWQVRLDTRRTLHHVMGRGIEGKKYSGKIGIGRIFCSASENNAGKDLWQSMPGGSWTAIFIYW